MDEHEPVLRDDAPRRGDRDRPPQRPQKAGNCSTKSMFGALNLLMVRGPADAKGADRYKAVAPNLRDALVGNECASPTVRAYEAHRSVKLSLAGGHRDNAVDFMLLEAGADAVTFERDILRLNDTNASKVLLNKRSVVQLMVSPIGRMRQALPRSGPPDFRAWIDEVTKETGRKFGQPGYGIAATRHALVRELGKKLTAAQVRATHKTNPVDAGPVRKEVGELCTQIPALPAVDAGFADFRAMLEDLRKEAATGK